MVEPFMFKFKAKLTSLKRRAQSVKLSIDEDQDLLTAPNNIKEKGKKPLFLPFTKKLINLSLTP
jgi:hypothetical protein